MAEELKQFKEEILNHFDKRTTELKQYFDEKTIETRRHFGVIDEALQHQIRQVAEGVSINTRQINAMQGDITGIKDKVEEIDVRLIGVEGKVEEIDVRLIGVENKVDGLEGRFDGLEKKFDSLDEKVDGLEKKFDGLDEKVDNLEKDIKIVKTDVGFIRSELSQKVSKKEFTFLENRVAKLENNA